MNINIACLITLMRILLTPVIVVLMVHNFWIAGFLVFLVAVLTDVVDGFVARWLQQQTKFGQLLDPVADKILLSSIMYTILMIMSTSVWFSVVFKFLLCKEIILLFGGGFLWCKYAMFIPPSVLSRAVSLCEVIFVCVVFIAKAFMIDVSAAVLLSIMGLNIILSIWLLVRYVLIVYDFSRRV